MHRLASDWPAYLMVGAYLVFIFLVARETRKNKKKNKESGSGQNKT